jgi:hypothetical protein
VGWFDRGPDAETSLATVAGELGFEGSPVQRGLELLPPTHRRVDIHQTGAYPKTPQRWLTCAGTLAGTGLPVRLSHLAIFPNDTEEHVYDLVTWRTPVRPPFTDHVEIGLGRSSARHQHHRLGVGFQGGLSRSIEFTDSAGRRGRLETVRSIGEEQLAPLLQPDVLGSIDLDPFRRSGLCVEVIEGEVCVYNLSGMRHRGRERWDALIGAARVLAPLVAALGQHPSGGGSPWAPPTLSP